MAETFYIIDGNSLLYRSFYAIPRLKNAKGELTNAIYGFINTLFKLIKTRHVDYLACVFDSPGPTVRHEKLDTYKGQRKGMPEELVVQLKPLKDVLGAMRIRVFEKERYEADDIMATLAQLAKKKSFDIHIVTGDKDAMQLVEDGVSILRPGKEETGISRKQVLALFGVEPLQVPDLIALMGDTSDNLPGVPGIGRKTASKLINEYGGIEEIYKNIDSMPNTSLASKLKEYKDVCFKTKELAILKRDIPLEGDLDECRYIGHDTAGLIKIFRTLGFIRLIQRILKADIHGLTASHAAKGPSAVRGKTDIKELINRCKKGKEAAVYFHKKKNTLVLAPDPNEIFVFDAPLPVKELKEILFDKDIKKIGHGFKDIIKRLHAQGLDIEGINFDLEIASYVINSERPSHDLIGLTLDYFAAPLSEEYGDIVKAIFSLKEKMASELKNAGQEELFYGIEMPLVPILAGMERYGILVNKGKLGRLSKKLEEEISAREDKIFSIAGEKFNLNSSQQTSRILFHKMGLPSQKRTKTGFSTDSSVLEVLAPVYPIAYEILSWRELYKMKSTYVDGMSELIDPDTGRLHTTFNQTVTSTGRLSSSNPNLQNIPARGEIAGDIRDVFEAPHGRLLASFDYSQIELRILAHFSDDRQLIEAFERGEDVHTATARSIWGLKKEDEVTSEMRRKAKIINFGIIYGMSGYGLARELRITPEDAEKYIADYMERFPKVKQYLEFLVNEAKKKGFTTTLSGRRRPLAGPDIEKLAINTPVQGSAADIIKLAMVKIDREFKKENLKASMLLQVHDELIFEVPEKEIKKVEKLVVSIMEGVYKLSVPLKVNFSKGMTWAKLE